MKKIPILFFLLHFLLQKFNLVFSLSSDGLSLLALKSSIDQSSDTSPFSDWNQNDSNPCHWTGISCMKIHGFDDPRVVGVSISGKNLTGYIPSELGGLTFLRRLNLQGNQFYGSIPDQIFSESSSLHSLFLYGNNLSGLLPPSICKPIRLQNLDLSKNSLSGSIPNYLANCRQLQRLILAGNEFSGEIPSGIWPNLQNLVQLDLSDNKFNGSIPSDLGELKSLSGTLNLSFNQFSGEIPKSLEKLPVTVSFDLRNNNLTGEIPQNGTFSNQVSNSFLNNPLLCGFPLLKPCDDTTITSTSQRNPNSESGNHEKEIEKNSKKGLKPSLIILISVVDAGGISILGIIIVYIYWKRKDSNSNNCICRGKRKFGGTEERGKICPFSACTCLNGFSGNESETESEKEGNGGGGGEGEGDLVAIDKGFNFELDELLRASAYVLGKSGLGIVYKVVLGNGIPVAVRRLGEGGGQRYKEFATEIEAIGKVKHRNIVRLRAYYWASDEKLLISDFISNGNLASSLHGRTGQTTRNLSWSTRLKIMKGIAKGLAYLHETSPRKFVHGNIKPTNILLDNEFNPYISDFGLNRLISITGTDPSSSGGIIGTALPYMKSTQTERSNNYKAPEARLIGNNARPTQKWDVYSFGVVLLEMLTGKSPESSSSPSTTTMSSTSTVTSLRGELGVDLVKWVRKGFEEEKPLVEIVDPMLLQEVQAKKEVLSVFHVALACTESDPEIRPKMKIVCDNLDKIG